MTPVDCAARLAVQLLRSICARSAGGFQTFQLCSPHPPAPLSLLGEGAALAGYELEACSYGEWRRRLLAVFSTRRESSSSRPSLQPDPVPPDPNPLFALLPFFVSEGLALGMGRHGCRKLEQELRGQQQNVACPPPSAELASLYTVYLLGRGARTPPRF